VDAHFKIPSRREWPATGPDLQIQLPEADDGEED
jgi:hypothetical protein